MRSRVLVASLALVGLTWIGAVNADPGMDKARDLYKQATAAFGLAQYDEAARLYEAAFQAHPDDSLLFNAAQAHRLAGEARRALELYKNYLRLYPSGPFAAQARRQIAQLDRPSVAAPAAPVAPPGGQAPSVTPAAAVLLPAAARLSPVAAGAAECATTTAQLELEGPLPGVDVVRGDGRAFTNPTIDRARAWCGHGALRVQADFALSGKRTPAGVLPYQVGEISLKLPSRIDLTNRTLIAHVYVDGPAGVPFGAQVLAVNHEVWVSGTATNNQQTGRWIALSHTFAADNRVYTGGTSKVNDVDAVVIELWAAGAKPQRTWSGVVYVDDVTWR